jgi:tRNA threonylcarbamoyladenosine biosynthesis protein TsaB
VARLAVQAYARGEIVAPERLEPAYLRDKVALTLAEQGKPRPS